MSVISSQPADNVPLVRDKWRFFLKQSETTNRAQALAITHARATTLPHEFLSSNLLSIEHEFNQLLAVLSSDDQDRENLWLYCYYCCILLATYYSPAHYNSAAAYSKYQHLAKSIEQRYTTGAFPPDALKTLRTKLYDDLKEILSTPLHLSSMKAWVGWGNPNRLALTFARLSIQEFLNILQDKQWLAMLNRFLHLTQGIDDMNTRLNTPAATFRALSVGFFAVRLLINSTLLLKHTFFPSLGEKEINASTRFYQDLKKRQATMLNDIVWTILNALTNYARFFKLSAPTANLLLVTGLVFDVSLLAWRLHASTQAFEVKRTQYIREKREACLTLERLLANTTTPNIELKTAQYTVRCLDDQLTQLNIQQHASHAMFNANIVAASLLATGYSAALLFALPAAVFISYFTIVVGVALYLAADAYGTYEGKRLQLHHMTVLGDNHAIVTAKDNTQKAWNDFTSTLFKNTAGPMILMGALALSWQAAFVVTLLYLSTEGYRYCMDTKKEPTTAPQITI